MTRPAPVILFERLYLTSIGLAATEAVLLGGAAVPDAPPGFTLTVEFTVMAAIAALVLLASRRGSRSARIVLALLFAISLPLTFVRLVPFETALTGMLEVAQGLLDTISIVLLFHPAAKAWFRSK